MKTLDDLACQHGTDKGSGWHAYTPVYERYLAARRDEPLKLLEIGVASGASLRMWRDYFGAATCAGIDTLPSCASVADGDRVRVFIGHQADRAFLDRVVSEAGPFDVIIDDGGHLNPDIVASFDHLFPGLQPGGLYVIEDLHASYGLYGNQRALLRGLFQELIEALDKHGRQDLFVPLAWAQAFEKLDPGKLSYLERWLDFVHFYQSLAIVGKRR